MDYNRKRRRRSMMTYSQRSACSLFYERSVADGICQTRILRIVGLHSAPCLKRIKERNRTRRPFFFSFLTRDFVFMFFSRNGFPLWSFSIFYENSRRFSQLCVNDNCSVLTRVKDIGVQLSPVSLLPAINFRLCP